MSSERHGKMRTSLLLTVLMVLMTQVGYLDVLNTWSEGDHTLDATTTASESGSASSQSNFTASAEGADLTVDVPMTNITFQYDANAVSGSSGSTPLVYTNDRMAAGSYHTCSIVDDGDLKCWGRDNSGQLGDGGTTNTDTNAPSATSIDLGTGRTAVAVSGGAHNTCAILDSGELKCWGDNDFGQLGDGGNTDTNTPSSTAISFGSGRTADAVSAAHYFTCAILDNGDLKCWGRDNYGQLGDGGTTNTDTNAPSA
ncbi:MAG: RCC1 domain-containing protein, partial [Candidatus Poseidoniaceae archaeon]